MRWRPAALWIGALGVLGCAAGGRSESPSSSGGDSEPERGAPQTEVENGDGIDLPSPAGLPAAHVQPELIDFGRVAVGEVATHPIQVSNAGTVPLRITGVLLQGSPGFGLTHGGAGFEAGHTVELDPAVVVLPDAVETFAASFTSQTAAPAEGRVVFYTDDPAHPSGVQVGLKANPDVGCLLVNPKKVQFGANRVGIQAVQTVKVSSCDTSALVITGISLAEGSSPRFALEGFEAGGAPTEQQPLVVPVGAAATFQVEYLPAVMRPTDPDGRPVPDRAIILIESDALAAPVQVEVIALSVDHR